MAEYHKEIAKIRRGTFVADAWLKVKLLIAGLACLNLAVWGAKQLVAGLYDPIIRSLGA